MEFFWGLHADTTNEAGVISVRAGYVSAAVDRFVDSITSVAYLDGDRPHIIGARRSKPRAVFFIYIARYTTITTDTIVTGRFAAGLSKQIATSFNAQITGHTVNGNGVDSCTISTTFVGRPLNIGNKRTVAHSTLSSSL